MCPALAPTCPGAPASSRRLGGHRSLPQRLIHREVAAESLWVGGQSAEGSFGSFLSSGSFRSFSA